MEIKTSHPQSSIPLTSSLPLQCSLFAALGLLSHLAFFIRGEHHRRAPFLFRLYLSVGGAIFLSAIFIQGHNVKTAAVTSLLLISSYATPLFTSMVVYRVCFHRLRSFPGPPLAKVSKFWHVFKVLDSRQYLLLDSLREQYGDYVRTGTCTTPVELALNLAEDHY